MRASPPAPSPSLPSCPPSAALSSSIPPLPPLPLPHFTCPTLPLYLPSPSFSILLPLPSSLPPSPFIPPSHSLSLHISLSYSRSPSISTISLALPHSATQALRCPPSLPPSISLPLPRSILYPLSLPPYLPLPPLFLLFNPASSSMSPPSFPSLPLSMILASLVPFDPDVNSSLPSPNLILPLGYCCTKPKDSPLHPRLPPL